MRKGLFGIALSVWVGSAMGAELSPGALDATSSAVFLSGPIEPNDGATLRFLIQEARQKGVPVQFVVLNSPGGSVKGGADLAIVIRDHQISVAVLDGATCASACFMPFAAGKNKVVIAGARIGVHSASIGGLEPDQAKSTTVNIARFLHEFGVPEAILGRLVRTAPGEMGWLTAAELTAMQSVVVPRQPQAMPYVEQVATKVEPDAPVRKAVSDSEFRFARSLNDQALLLIKKDDYAGAIAILERATAVNPYDVEISGNLGYAELKTGNFAKAKSTLLLALQLNPKRWATWQNLGQSLAGLGDVSGAVHCFEKYVEHAPNPDKARALLRRWHETDASESLRMAAGQALQRMGG